MVKIYIFGTALLLLIAVLVVGYYKSDDVFYNDLIKSNNLTTPLKVFKWLTTNYGTPGKTVKAYVTPRYLIENHPSLWCDEGAIIMATLDHKIGYKTRLVDLYGFDNISHHTVLQVMEQNKWVTYDFTNRIYNNSLSESTKNLGYMLKYSKVKPYPRLYNALVNNNFFVKKLAFKLRGIEE